MTEKTKLLVVDDHSIVREGLKSLIDLDDDLTVTDEASSSMECLEKMEKSLPDVVLMDLKMPGVDGIEATRLIKQSYPWVKVILLTNYDDEEYVAESIKAGADGYILKDVKKGDLLQIIHKILQGQAFIDPGVTRKVFHQLKKTDVSNRESVKRPVLSHRELQIVILLVEGKSNKEIAEELFVSLDTVKSHLKNIYYKLNVHTRLQAVKSAIQSGLVHLFS